MVHLQVAIHLGPLLEGPGCRGKWHRLELLNAQFHQHKVGPALAQIAEEHQADAIEQGHVLQPDHSRSLTATRQPSPQGSWCIERFRQQLPHPGLTQRFRVTLLLQPIGELRP